MKKAIERGHADACTALAILYERFSDGRTRTQYEFVVAVGEFDPDGTSSSSMSEILNLYILGMKRGSILAMKRMIVWGNVPVNHHYQRPLYLLVEDARRDVPFAASILELCYHWGIQVPKDREVGNVWRAQVDRLYTTRSIVDDEQLHHDVNHTIFDNHLAAPPHRDVYLKGFREYRSFSSPMVDDMD